MNAKQLKAVRWHKKNMIAIMKREGIELGEIDETLDNIIEHLDEKRKQNPTDPDAIRREGYGIGYAKGQRVGYNDGWLSAANHFNRSDI